MVDYSPKNLVTILTAVKTKRGGQRKISTYIRGVKFGAKRVALNYNKGERDSQETIATTCSFKTHSKLNTPQM